MDSRAEQARKAWFRHLDERPAFDASNDAWDAWKERNVQLQRTLIDAVMESTIALPAAPAAERPEVVCLCGSTRFKAEYEAANERLTLAGAIVLAPGCFSRSTPDEAARGIFKGCTPEQKVALDALHLRKIDMADRVVVICPGGYIGESTAREIEYAMRTGKPVEFVEDAAEPADAARGLAEAVLLFTGGHGSIADLRAALSRYDAAQQVDARADAAREARDNLAHAARDFENADMEHEEYPGDDAEEMRRLKSARHTARCRMHSAWLAMESVESMKDTPITLGPGEADAAREVFHAAAEAASRAWAQRGPGQLESVDELLHEQHRAYDAYLAAQRQEGSDE